MKVIGDVLQPDDAGVYRTVRPREYVQFVDLKSDTTDGGTFTSGAWRTRVLLNTIGGIKGASLASNQITLPAGIYDIQASAPGFSTNRHQTRWQNTTDAETTIYGTSEYVSTINPNQTRSFLSGRFTIAAQKVFELQHRCNTTKEDNGLGVANSFNISEVYAIVELRKVG